MCGTLPVRAVGSVVSGEGALIAILVWSSCRFLLLSFYVLEKYVDADKRYRGLWHSSDLSFAQDA